MRWLIAFLTLALLSCAPMDRGGDRARITKGRADIHSFMTALATYKLDVGSFPSTAQGLDALHKNPGVTGWSGPYIQQDIPLDPWGHAYDYKFPGDHGDEPDIICYGADGRPGGEGINADIVSWTKQ